MKNDSFKFRTVVVLSIVSLLFLLIYTILSNSGIAGSIPGGQIALIAKSRDLMVEALTEIRKEKEKRDIKIDGTLDPNRTGLIGVEYSFLTTTMGHLESKRTSVNPDTAAMICGIFLEEGLKAGDSVAIGSSASFPGLLIATLMACKVLELNPITIVSFGSSQYGANNPEFSIIDMLKTLEVRFGKVFNPAAITYGGNDDIANDLDEDAIEFMREKTDLSGYPLLYEADFSRNIRMRMQYYDELAQTPVRLFVNIGGAISNIGSNPEILNLEPGINKDLKRIPSAGQRGVLYEFASRDISVLHLLYVKGLSLRYGLTWEPIPFKAESYKKLSFFQNVDKGLYTIFFSLYVFCIFISFFIMKKTK